MFSLLGLAHFVIYLSCETACARCQERERTSTAYLVVVLGCLGEVLVEFDKFVVVSQPKTVKWVTCIVSALCIGRTLFYLGIVDL